MAKRKLTNKLIHKSKINEEMRKIDESNIDYITPTGKIYCDYGNDMYYPKTNYRNKYNGYWYVSIKHKNGKQVNRRVHNLLAKAYIQNPNNYPIVMHLNNNKDVYSLKNLKWGTVQENTQQAFDDKLEINAKGFEDSQSIPVCAFDLNKKLRNIYGSISIAAKENNVSKHCIVYQCQHKAHLTPRKGIYYRFLDEYEKEGFVL